MKKLALAVVSVVLVGVGSLNAATPTPTKGGTPAVQNVNERMKEQMRQTQKDLKAGKLTAAQAAAVKKQILAIRQEELSDMKANGEKQLTDSQKAQLNSELDETQGSV